MKAKEGDSEPNLRTLFVQKPVTSIMMLSVSHPGLDDGLKPSLKQLEKGWMRAVQEVLEAHQTLRHR